MAAVGSELQKRGHRITFFQVPDIEAAVKRAGLEFHTIGKDLSPLGSIKKLDDKLSTLKGISALHYGVARCNEQICMFFNEAPAAIRSAGIDALLIDECEAYGPVIAEHLGLPYVHVSMALPLVFDEGIPPYYTSWRYRVDYLGRLRNRIGYRMFSHLITPIMKTIKEQRSQWELPLQEDRKSRRARLASISQLPSCLDFPRILIPRFHYTGPFGLRAARPSIDFPWEKLDGRPLIYGALGTVMARPPILRTIAKACEGLHAQLVLSLGGAPVTPEEIGPLPGNPILVAYAPQLELIKKAALVVTHGGLNTVLESLFYGIPLVLLPFNNDQPGVAARVAWTGAGDFISGKRVWAGKLRTTLQRVLSQPSYRQAAQRVQEEIASIDGLDAAANIVENTFGVKTISDQLQRQSHESGSLQSAVSVA